MPLDPPPGRYRVVERGRRLEVIDTQADARAPAPRPGTPSGGWPDGRRTFTTRAFYDARGPRTIAIGEGVFPMVAVTGAALAVATGAVLTLAPWLAAVPVVLAFQPGVRGAARTAATRLLDRLAVRGG
jgi:hypothetical protein